jgi:glutathione S-transferase
MTAVTALPVLYSFRRCPYAMRARLALLASGQACVLREVVLARKPQALIDASPKATVPVLVLEGGPVLDQSLDIMLWALRRADPLGWLTPTQGDLAQMLALVAQCDTGFKRDLDHYKYPQRSGLADGGLAARASGAAFLQELERQLAASPYLFGTHAALADMAIAPFIRQYAGVAPDWFAQQPWPALQAWLAHWQQSALLERAMHKFAAWQPGAAPVVFGPSVPTASGRAESSDSSDAAAAAATSPVSQGR